MHDLPLGPETVVRLSPSLRTRMDAAGRVLLDSPSGTVVDLGPRGYRLLALLARDQTLGVVLERVEAELEPTAVAPTIGALNQLLEESALVLADGHPGPRSGWADPVEHGRMLHDERRTLDYLTAVKQAVRPGDVVLDIGTGSGVLAVAAARAGARRVYAVEASDIAAVAADVFVANGVGDRVRLIPGWSRRVELPERADVLVSEIIGNEPFEEELLETTLDARRRLLRPGARQIPAHLRLDVRPLRLPGSEARQRAVGESAIERWRRLYGMDFSPLVDAALPGPVLVPTEAEVAAAWPAVGPPVPLVHVDLTERDDLRICAETDLVVEEGGEVNAVAVTFHADLFGGVAHEMDPWRWPTSSWAVSVWVMPDTVTPGRGSTLTVTYTRRVAGVADGLTIEQRPQSRRHLGSSRRDDAASGGRP